jgi:hypothetical protein
MKEGKIEMYSCFLLKQGIPRIYVGFVKVYYIRKLSQNISNFNWGENKLSEGIIKGVVDKAKFIYQVTCGVRIYDWTIYSGR